MPAFTDAQLHNIQGLGIAGFRKDHQELIFVRLGDVAGARRDDQVLPSPDERLKRPDLVNVGPLENAYTGRKSSQKG